MKNLERCILHMVLIMVVITISCAGPLYFNKNAKLATGAETIYFVPSHYFGKLYYLEKSPGGKSSEYKCLSFEKWELFDEKINRITRNVFKKHGIILDFMETISPELQVMINEDSVKKIPEQYLSLKNIHKDKFESEMNNLNAGVVIIFSEFNLIRVFPVVAIEAKYYVYDIPNGNLILANYHKKTYYMKAMFMEALFGNDENEWLKAWRERVYGLWDDEQESYAAICDLFVTEIASFIVKKCMLR